MKGFRSFLAVELETDLIITLILVGLIFDGRTLTFGGAFVNDTFGVYMKALVLVASATATTYIHNLFPPTRTYTNLPHHTPTHLPHLHKHYTAAAPETINLPPPRLTTPSIQ